jgi:crotonyl-CoA carboxylase/reductase
MAYAGKTNGAAGTHGTHAVIGTNGHHAPPADMAAQVIRADRFGAPREAFRLERLPMPRPRADEVLLRVMAAGVNHNGVFAALGRPLDVIEGHRRAGWNVDFHVAGSDAAGEVVAVGPDVQRVRPGDAVVVHGGTWDRDCPHVLSGGDPALSPSMRAWGYQTPYGAFAEYAVAQEHQCLTKPKRLTWEEAAGVMVGAATAVRMLRGWPPHTAGPGDVVLVWGGAGGLGSHAIQVARAHGACVVAVVSSGERAEFCRELGAAGCVDRRHFTHWGPLPDWRDALAQRVWREQARAFRDAVRAASGLGRDPTLVVEHPGEDTLPTSMFCCAAGGMVVTCAGTSGYGGSFDLRTAWMWQKRLQGSHGMNDTDAATALELLEDGRLRPCIAAVLRFDEVGEAHQMLLENRQPPGHLVVLVGAAAPGLGRGR